MSEIQHDYDLLIAGGGLVGALTALAFSSNTDRNRCKQRIALIDPDFFARESLVNAPVHRTVALTFSVTKWLESLGVLHYLDTQDYLPFKGMVVWDHNTSGSLSFHASDVHQANMGIIFDSHKLLQACYQALINYDVSYVYGQVKKVEQDAQQVQVLVEQKNQPLQSITAALLVAADGRRSLISDQLGLSGDAIAYEQKAFVAQACISGQHQSLAHQVFLPTGPLAFLPLPSSLAGQSHVSMVWSMDNDLAEQASSWSLESWARQASRYIPQTGQLEFLAKPQAFGLEHHHAKHYFCKRTVLVGDALHGIHPLAGQGLNLGCQDVISLVQLSSRYGVPLADVRFDVLQKTLQQYQLDRHSENEIMRKTMSVFKHLFSVKQPMFAYLRSLGMRATNHVLPVKSKITALAMGLDRV